MNSIDATKNKSAETAPFLSISDGTLETLKWLGLISMTIDHFNRFFLNSSSTLSFQVGRVAMPLFAFIFAYNFARYNPIPISVYLKSIKRLFLFGILAIPAYINMQHLSFIFPLNIMFMFLICTNLFFLMQEKNTINRIFAFLLFFMGGFFVEYNWMGILLCFFWYINLRSISFFSLFGLSIAYLLLDLINGNHWALISLPLILLAPRIKIKVPRIPYLFYIYYPLHLSLFWLSKTFLQKW